MGLGFVVARFGLLLRELSPSVPQHVPIRVSTVFGTALVLCGAALLALATWRYRQVGHAIERHEYHWSPVLGFALGALLVLAALALAAYLIVSA